VIVVDTLRSACEKRKVNGWNGASKMLEVYTAAEWLVSQSATACGIISKML